jgi:hypothetical protein
MTDYTEKAITADAERAARLGQTILDACPWPWFTEEGRLWRRVFRKLTGAAS